jgi:uncharacterized membrane protein YeaQ/YmgE (transglycosylase-associated protein family)
LIGIELSLQEVFMLGSLLGWIILGGLAGWLGARIAKGRGYGCLANIILGIVGAVIGGWLFSLIGLHMGGVFGSFITAVVGAAVLISIFQLFSRR